MFSCSARRGTRMLLLVFQFSVRAGIEIMKLFVSELMIFIMNVLPVPFGPDRRMPRALHGSSTLMVSCREIWLIEALLLWLKM